MAEPAELAQLKDIHLPPDITWWPLAPGWYLLGAAVLLAVLILISVHRKRKVNARPKKQALVLLQACALQNNTQDVCAQISEILRRVALVYFPREKVAGLHGQAWIEFLNNTGKKTNFTAVQALLLEAPFNKQVQADLTPLINTAKRWIKQRKVPCSN